MSKTKIQWIGTMCIILASGLLEGTAWASEKVLALERQELAQDCASIEFLDGFVTRVDANGDDLPDYLVNTQHLMCDGSQMMWCGTMGCVHRIWLQQQDGNFNKTLDTYAYEIVFDRHGDLSYKVTTRDGTRRERLPGASSNDKDLSVQAGATAPSDRWVYQDSPAPAAIIGPPDAQLSLTCEAGALRMRYSGWWLFDGDNIHQATRDWDKSEYGIVPTFAIGSHETDIPVRISEEERMLVAKETLPLTAPLIDALARGSRVTLIHGGSLEHELGYPLSGSSSALDALRANCR